MILAVVPVVWSGCTTGNRSGSEPASQASESASGADRDKVERLAEAFSNSAWLMSYHYAEMPKAERAKIFEETRGMDDRALGHYVCGSSEHAFAFGRLDDTSAVSQSLALRVEQQDEVVNAAAAKFGEAVTEADRAVRLRDLRIKLLMADSIRGRLRLIVAGARHRIALYRDSEPARFSWDAFRRAQNYSSDAKTPDAVELYLKWRAAGDGFHRFLCATAQEIRRRSLGRQWFDVEDDLVSDYRGAQVGEEAFQDLRRFRYSLSPVGWIGRDGLRHEWFYEFDVSWRVPDFGPRGLVKAAKSGLSVAPNERYSEFMSREVYPRDS